MNTPTRVSERHRPRLTILVKLLLAFAVPTTALFSGFAMVAHEVAHDDLEAELGIRLQAIASAAALQIRGKYLVELGPGQEDDRGYQNARRKLLAAREATGASRMYIFDRELLSRVDTEDGIPIASKYFQAALDRHEILRVLDEGAAVSSVLFVGADGVQYKAGYAPIRASDKDRESEIVLALGVEAPAAYFDRLASLKSSLILYGVALALVVLAISVFVAALITRPVRHLASVAERIGRGDLAEPVKRRSRDEIGFLAETMEEMREELSARDEKLQLMLSGIAHEVRNPLGGMELFAGILRDELEPDDERRTHVARIEKELTYLKAVVNDFLDYARRPAPELREVDAAGLVAEVADLLRADADAAGVTIAVDAEPARCRADSGQLRRALINLVRNAVQAATDAPSGKGAGTASGQSRSPVQVTVQALNPGARIAVHNRGKAIPEKVRERIFEPFYTTREKGTGLGLAFVHEIVVDHGGHIELESHDGETRFTIELG